MSNERSGGCRCRQVRYTCSAEPVFTGHCHCRDCQYASGGAYSTVVLLPREAVSVQGETRRYAVTAESGNQVTRVFCPTCGTPLFSELEGMQALLVVKAATFDDPAFVAPLMHIWTASSQPWAEMSGKLPAFARNPE